VAAYKGKDLIYCGRAGSGFSGAQLTEVSATLQAIVRKTPPCQPPENGALPKGADHTWVEPQLVCDVRYKEFTREGLLRQSVFVRFRDDKKPEDVVMPGTGVVGRGTGSSDASPTRPPSPAPRPREVKLSNLDKVFWPDEKYTKGDLIEYYRSMAPWLLPYLKNRPVVLTRYPDGINGKSFYQKDAPGFVPDWIETIPIWSEDTQRDIQYFVCNDVESLTYLVNLGTIPLHIWHSRIDDLTKPDWCLIDLDPKEAPFADVVKLAKTMKSLCDEVEMPSFIKTTGKSGLHIMMPLGRQLTYDQSLQLAILFSRLVTDRHPRYRDDAAHDQQTRRQGVRRRVPESRVAAHGLGVQRAAGAGRAGVDADRVGRGERQAAQFELDDRERAQTDGEDEAGSRAAGADDQAQPDGDPGAPQRTACLSGRPMRGRCTCSRTAPGPGCAIPFSSTRQNALPRRESVLTAMSFRI
jgi:DNA ligase D